MGQITYIEEDFKQVLKNLFSEKKKVKALQRQISEKGMQKKFQGKLLNIHHASLTEEYLALKSAYQEKEKNCLDLANKLEKVRPVVKRLVDELKQAHKQLNIESLSEEKLKSTLKEEKERFESEKSRLLERIAENVTQLKAELEKKHHIEGENQQLKHHIDQIEQKWRAEREAYSLKSEEWELQEKAFQELSAQLATAKKQLQESDLGTVREEYENKLSEQAKGLAAAKEEYQTLNAQFNLALEDKEKLLEKSYQKMRELASRHAQMVEDLEKVSQDVEEKTLKIHRMEKLLDSQGQKDVEIRKAQEHLAKKVKEFTILHELSESQSEKIIELEQKCDRLYLEHTHEQKLQQIGQERVQAAETLAKEWQEKYLAFEAKSQADKDKLNHLENIEQDYEKMVAKVTSLKSILEKSEEK